MPYSKPRLQRELEQNIKFVRSDLDSNVYSKIHELYYDSNVGRINIEPYLQVRFRNQFNQWGLQRWKLETSPKGLTHSDIINLWYKDYKASEIAMEKTLEKQRLNMGLKGNKTKNNQKGHSF